MSNDSPSGSAAPSGEPPGTTDHDRTIVPSGDRGTGSRHHGAVQELRRDTPARRPVSRGSRRRRRKKRTKKANPGLKKKLELVTHLLKGLDNLVFAELSAMYYMECSTFRLIIRAVSQAMYLSPKSESFPFLMPASRMHVALVVLPNLWCMLIHLLAALPEGREYHRGYLHGGVIIDFIGQEPPVHRLYYILADVFLLVLQCLMLTIHTEREKLRLSLKTFRPLVASAALEAATSRTVDDLDAEERNIGSTQADDDDAEDGIELQPLRRRSTSSNGGGRDEEAAGTEPRRPSSSSGEAVTRSRLSDILTSGNGVLGEYHIVRSLRVAATELERTTAQSLQSIGYRATLAALNTRRQSASIQTRPQQASGGD
ncbi:Fungal domain of unknown function (DUF1746) [Geosmithia morbida]|uniref:DUF1746 domain-containing protein n=1 Tax=Geosmithia morbida TaxID=1094350 RepID=A0A9P4YTD1_9HYPO|nr:Fungal domain of unknown function (DUF1746) [Geosmithia morbida]KAF4122445.1 Fungal domain of unknown function (DUF1746) [Geosmithia morbida]